MNHKLSQAILCTTLVAAGHCMKAHAGDQGQATESGMARTAAVLLTVSASVESIDYNDREVTLKGPLGNEVTFTVDKRVKRLKEVKVGDFVTADYYVSIAAELREPTAEEEQHPITVLEGAAKAPPETSPAAGGLRRFKVVATVEGLDRPTQTVTVKGPLGHYLTVRAADPENLTKMRIGDHIVVTYTEALAVSLRKRERKSQD